jgi:hypothetical protein
MERLCRFMASVGFVVLVFMSFLTMFDAFMRYMIWPSIPGFTDWGRIMFPIIICSVFPALLLYRRNVSIGFLGALLGPQWNRALELFGAVLTLVFFVFIAWQFTVLGVDMQVNGRVTPTQKNRSRPLVVGGYSFRHPLSAGPNLDDLQGCAGTASAPRHGRI